MSHSPTSADPDPPLPAELVSRLDGFKQAVDSASTNVYSEYSKLKKALKPMRKNVWGLFDHRVQCIIAQAHLNTSHCAARVDQIAKSNWSVSIDQLLFDFGPHALMSRSFVDKVACFAEQAKPPLTWADALSAIKDEMAARLSQHRRGIQNVHTPQPVDVDNAMAKYNIKNVTLRKPKRGGGHTRKDNDEAAARHSHHQECRSPSVNSEASIELPRQRAPSIEGRFDLIEGGPSNLYDDCEDNDDEDHKMGEDGNEGQDGEECEYNEGNDEVVDIGDIRDEPISDDSTHDDLFGNAYTREDPLPEDHNPEVQTPEVDTAEGHREGLNTPQSHPKALKFTSFAEDLRSSDLKSRDMSLILPEAEAEKHATEADEESKNLQLGTQNSPAKTSLARSPPAASPLQGRRRRSRSALESQRDSAWDIKLVDQNFSKPSADSQKRRKLHSSLATTSNFHESAASNAQAIQHDEENEDEVFLRRLSGSNWLGHGEIFRILALFEQPHVRVLEIHRSVDDGPWKDWRCPYTRKPEQEHVLAPLIDRGRRHWILLHLDIKAMRAYIYDSLAPSAGVDNLEMVQAVAKSLGLPWDKFEVHTKKLVRQDGNGDCGVFALTFAFCVIARARTPVRINPQLWRKIFLLQTLAHKVPPRRLVHDLALPPPSQAIDPISLSGQLIQRFRKAAAEKERLAGLKDDMTSLSGLILDFLEQNRKQADTAKSEVTASSNDLERRQGQLASFSADQFSTATAFDEEIRQNIGLSINAVKDCLNRAQKKLELTQERGNRLIATCKLLRDFIDERIAQNNDEYARARAEMKDVSDALRLAEQ